MLTSNKLGPYELNTIITGDAKELAKTIPDESIDLIFTDPPYGIDFKYDNGYKDNPDTYLSILKWLVVECQRICKLDGYCFVYQSQARLRETWQLFPKSRLYIEAQNFHQLNRLDNPFRFGVDYGYQPIIYWRRTQTNEMIGSRDWFIANTAKTQGRMNYEKVWHKAGRPLDSVVNIIDKFTSFNNVVLDFFAGSGTTAVASKILSRNYLAFEIDPATAELARERVANTQPPLFVMQPEQLELC